MLHSVENHIKPCGCRSAGECTCNEFAEREALNALVDDFATAVKEKLNRKYFEGAAGWDNPRWTPEQIKAALLEHVVKGDMLDVAAFAAFLWNRQ